MLVILFMIGYLVILYPVVLKVIYLQDNDEHIKLCKRKINYYNNCLKFSNNIESYKLVFDTDYNQYSLFVDIKQKFLINKTYKNCVDEYYSIYKPFWSEVRLFIKRLFFLIILFFILTFLLLITGYISVLSGVSTRHFNVLSEASPFSVLSEATF